MNNDPFAKLSAIDQKLFQRTTEKRPSAIQPESPPSAQKQTPPQPPAAPTVKKKNIDGTAQQSSDTTVSRYHDSMQPRYDDTNPDTVIPRHHDTTFETIRRAVKQFGKEAATHRFTVEEKKALKSIERYYEEKDIRTSENEITRISINYMIEDYRKNGEDSILAHVLRLLNS